MEHPPMLSPTGLVQPVPRRVRAVVGDQTIVDTLDVRYVWEHPFYPKFALPPEALDGLVEDDGATESGPLGEMALHTLVVGDRRVAGAARRITDASVAEGLVGWWRLDWDAVDAWFEEDEQLVVHPRSPYVRVDALPSSRRVRVEADGVVLADTDRPVLLFETGLPTRHYLPSEDVRTDLLTPIELRTTCPYKGTVDAYWSVTARDTTVDEVAWRYDDPRPAVEAIADHVAFLDEKVDTFIDGVEQDRPAPPRG